MAKKKPPTKAESEHMARIKELSCVVCEAPPPSDCHHITSGGRRLGHKYTLPLCYNCHRGDDGFSGKNSEAWDKSLNNQLRLLAKTKQMLDEENSTFIYRKETRDR